MIIGIDIDGVILDFERVMRTTAEFYDLFLNKNGVTNPYEFDYLKRYNWTKEEQKKFINRYLINNTYLTQLLPGVKEGMEILKNFQITLIGITARGLIKKETQKAVLKVIKQYNLPFSNIYFAVKDKLSLCQKLKVDLMIDDNPHISQSLSLNGITTLYFRDKGNQILKENNYLHEVSNWGEICRFVIDKYELSLDEINLARILKIS